MSDVLTEFENLVTNSDIMRIVMFMADHEIPNATVTLFKNLVFDFKLGKKNNHNSFSLEIYAKPEN